MELWIVFSLLGAFLYAVSNVLDKYIMGKLLNNPILPTIIYVIASIVVAISIYFIRGIQILPLDAIIWAALVGVLDVIAALLYFKAVQIEEVSRVIGLLYVIPLFVALLAAVFLGEVFTFLTYFGIVIIVIGALLLTSQNLKFELKKSTFYILSAAFMWAVTTIILKHLLNSIDFWTVFSYTRMGMLLAIMPIIVLNYRRILHSIENEKLGISANFVNQLFAVVPDILAVVAVSVGYATLVNSLFSGTQPFFVLGITVMLSVIFPHIIKEDISKVNVISKFVGILLIFFGGLFIT